MNRWGMRLQEVCAVRRGRWFALCAVLLLAAIHQTHAGPRFKGKSGLAAPLPGVEALLSRKVPAPKNLASKATPGLSRMAPAAAMLTVAPGINRFLSAAKPASALGNKMVAGGSSRNI